jgi:bacterioferritin-associated ferredoxin
MIVCLCNALNEACIKVAIESGARTVGQVYDDCGAIPRCGQCRPDIALMLTESSLEPRSAGALAGSNCVGSVRDSATPNHEHLRESGKARELPRPTRYA